MELQYLYHSGFAIKSDEFTMVIDYYLDSCREGSGSQGTLRRHSENGVVDEDLLSRPGKFYVLVSHSHPDHYNSVILQWKKIREDIIYIFSQDIANQDTREVAHFLEKGQSYQDEILRITAYGSTDMGISFAIQTKKGVNIFHAGDLNNWHWKDEVPASEAKGYEDSFLKELSDISRDYSYFHAAMFPVDPRLGKDYMLGATQFLEAVKAGLFAPMHFGGSYEKAAAFEKDAVSKGSRFARWTHRGQAYTF